MSMSVGGGQLPISAFFSSSTQSSRRTSKTGNPKLSPKRKIAVVGGAHNLENPPKKKRKQKENLSPSRRQSSIDVESKFEESDSSPRIKTSRNPLAGNGEDNILDINNASGVEKALTLPEVDDSSLLKFREIRSVETRPVTPQRPVRGCTDNGGNTLPSPPLTDPTIMRARPSGGEESSNEDTPNVSRLTSNTARYMVGVGNHHGVTGSSPGHASSGGTGYHRAEDKGYSDAQPPISSRELMPPPPLPPRLRVPSDMLPVRPSINVVQRPRSSSSDRWVPSSQSQELSIPRYHYREHTALSHKSSYADEGEELIVPSSQADEQELEIPESPVHNTRGRSRALCPLHSSEAIFQSSRERTSSNEAQRGGDEYESPTIVESSQSQFEAEITPAWAETIGARIAALNRASETASSPPREPESQGYDAQDEYSPQRESSQISLEDIPKMSPAPDRVSSQMTASSTSDDSVPFSRTPSPLVRLRKLFEGRDERGNILPVVDERNRWSSPSGSRRQRAILPVSSQDPSGSEVDDDPLAAISASPPRIPSEHNSDDCTSDDVTSGSETMPSAMARFLTMFSSQEDAESGAASYPESQTESQVEVAQVLDRDPTQTEVPDDWYC